MKVSLRNFYIIGLLSVCLGACASSKKGAASEVVPNTVKTDASNLKINDSAQTYSSSTNGKVNPQAPLPPVDLPPDFGAPQQQPVEASLPKVSKDGLRLPQMTDLPQDAEFKGNQTTTTSGTVIARPPTAPPERKTSAPANQ